MKRTLLILVLAVQSAWLLAITAVQEHALSAGKVILLETERIDPRDMLRGDYLILNYKISSVPKNLFSPPLKTNPAPGDKVYVAVTEGPDHFYTVARASTAEFEPQANEVVLLATASERWWGQGDPVRLDYGLDRFYVAEGTGHPNGKLTVRAAVPSSGHAIIKEVLVDGKPYVATVKKDR